MAKRGRKKAVAQSLLKPKAAATVMAASDPVKRQIAFNNQELERRIAAIKAIQAAEVESLLSQLRLIRSYFSKDQMEIPVLQFIKENLPNISPVINEKFKVVDMKWKDVNYGGGNLQASVGGGIPLSVRSVQSNFLDITKLQIPDFVLDEPSDSQMTGMRDSLQTPGETSTRFSFGMTPKTLRLPKKGEMLMSVRGSPLGVYKEENLEAIHESVDGSHDGASH